MPRFLMGQNFRAGASHPLIRPMPESKHSFFWEIVPYFDDVEDNGDADDNEDESVYLVSVKKLVKKNGT